MFRNSFHSQDDLSKVVRSLRRLFLCMCDLFDMLENCVEVLDPVKKKSLYLQIEPSVSLIKVFFSVSSLSIRIHYQIYEIIIQSDFVKKVFTFHSKKLSLLWMHLYWLFVKNVIV